MSRGNSSPFRRPGTGEEADKPGAGLSTAPVDTHPRSNPEDRNEGNLNPDPALECWECKVEAHHLHAPSGEPSDDDGAGNVSPREVLEVYGQEDVDGLEMEPDRPGPGAR